MSGTWSGRRNQATAARSDRDSRAVWTLAGKTATNSNALAYAPTLRVLGSSRRSAHVISATPLTATTSDRQRVSGLGTIRRYGRGLTT
jgi:hypothetical protein